MKATEIFTIVTIPTIRTNWSLKGWNVFRVAIKTFQTPSVILILNGR